MILADLELIISKEIDIFKVQKDFNPNNSSRFPVFH